MNAGGQGGNRMAEEETKKPSWEEELTQYIQHIIPPKVVEQGLFCFLNFMEIQLIYKVVITSAEQKRHPVVHRHVSILPQILTPRRLSQMTG